MLKWFISLDTETTGLSPTRDYLLSIGATLYSVYEKDKTYSIADKFHCYLYSQFQKGQKTAKAISVNGLFNYSDDSIWGDFHDRAEEPEDVTGRFFKWLCNVSADANGSLNLIGHHIYFDLAFIERALAKHYDIIDFSSIFNRPYFDTKLIGYLKGDVKNTSLDNMVKYYFNQVQGSPHSALHDSELTGKLYFEAFNDYTHVLQHPPGAY